MKLLTALVVAASLIGPTVQAKKRPKPCTHGEAIQRKHCKAHRLCSNARPRWCVENSIIHNRRWMTRWQRSWMRATPWCESRWNPGASSAGNLGLYQFRQSTWNGTPYRRRSIWSAKWQSLAAGWMVHQGRTSEWPNCP